MHLYNGAQQNMSAQYKSLHQYNSVPHTVFSEMALQLGECFDTWNCQKFPGSLTE